MVLRPSHERSVTPPRSCSYTWRNHKDGSYLWRAVADDFSKHITENHVELSLNNIEFSLALQGVRLLGEEIGDCF